MGHGITFSHTHGETKLAFDSDDRHDGGIPDPEPAAASGSVAAESVKSTPRRAESYSHLIPNQQPAGVRRAMRKTFCFGGSRLAKRMSERAPMVDGCVFCDIARRAPTSTTALLYSDDKVVAFRDINPSAFRHYLVIPIDHMPTVNSLCKTKDDHQLVSHMLKVGKDLLNQDAPNSEEHRFGFHQPPFNSVDHLHLHCLALPFMPSWRQVKYTPLGPLGGFIEGEKLLERIKPEAEVYS